MRLSHRCVSAGVIVFFLCLFSPAQEFPRTEIFGGYSYLHVDTQGVTGQSLTNQCNIASGGACPVTFEVHPGFNGWNIAPQLNLTNWFGVKAQFAGQYGHIVTVKSNSTLPLPPFSIPGQHIYDFLFGPVLSHRSDKYRVFVHGLLGGQHVGLNSSSIGGVTAFGDTSETNLAFALGGGVDLRASKHFAIRLGQFDYEFVKTSGQHQNDFRYSGGVVFAFGGM